MKKLITLLLCGCFIIKVSCAQQNNYSVLFKSGTITPGCNLAEFTQHGGLNTLPVFDGKYYCLVQFNAIPSNNQKALIESAGIHLLSYIPHNAWIASIDENANVASFNDLNIRSITGMATVQKLSHELRESPLPDWAIKQPGTIDLVVQYFKDAEYMRVAAALRDAGCEILHHNKNVSAYTVRVNSETGINALAALPYIEYMQSIPHDPVPDDTKGRTLHRSNVIDADYANGLQFDGSGVTVAIGDDGSISHIDFQGRVTDLTENGAGMNHGDMTSGICIGAGNLNPDNRGMATGAQLVLFDLNGSSQGSYPQVVNAAGNFTNYNAVISSTSFDQVSCNSYSADAQTADQVLHSNPQLTACFSAGNTNPNNCGYGAGNQWGNITGGYKDGKNVITVSSLDTLGALQGNSSRGPASDGRIKPDIGALGQNEVSTGTNNTYQNGNGTSAACPAVAGVCAQLYEAYKSMNGGANPDGALIKACILNSATDLGNPGPDYQNGWGRVNASAAYKILAGGNYLYDSVAQGTSNTHTITVPAGATQLKVMLYWNDVEGDPAAFKALVNDIDLTVEDPSSVTSLPLVLDPTPNAVNLNANAVQGVDTLNNMEQVSISSPAAGTYTVTVNGTAVPQGPQSYYIVWEATDSLIHLVYPIGGEGFVPGTVEKIRWDAPGTAGTFTIRYSLDSGMNWFTQTSGLLGTQREYVWAIPTAAAYLSGKVLVAIINGSNADTSKAVFTILDTPQNLHVDYACTDSIHLMWDSVPGATDYQVYSLGTLYMDSIGTTTATDFLVTPTNVASAYWFSVAAMKDGNTGKRAVAIQKLPGVVNCPLAVDAGIAGIVSPGSLLNDCANDTAAVVSVLMRNDGLDTIAGIGLGYSLNGAAAVTDTFPGTLAPGATFTFSFMQTINLSVAGNYTLQVWLNYPGDLNVGNDTLTLNITVAAGTIASLPFTENFDSFTICPNVFGAMCDTTTCPLIDGFNNAVNSVEDTSDWKVHTGPTPTANTGPTGDHTTGSGNFVYVEASICFNQLAVMTSPCINLTTALTPQLSFWYHMFGAAMGTMHLDILSGGTWNNDVWQLTGDQGNQWLQAIVDLTPYVGNVITLRYRGETGNLQTSDMALDDINITETSAPPVVSFNASSLILCTAAPVQFTDHSTNSPTSWQWNITPATFTFVNGTSATSQNPQVQFNTTGPYDVTLLATNSFGTDSSIQTYNLTFISSNAAAVPFAEDFQGAAFPPADWDIVNPTGGITWVKQSGITGSDGNPTDAAFMDNFNYNSLQSEDYMITPQFNLTGLTGPYMFFDVAYTRRAMGLGDTLRIDISTDCGTTWQNGVYYKGGIDLRTTVGNFMMQWFPNNANQWRRDTVDLTPFAGQQIKARFTNINRNQNSLFVDNINIAFVTGISENTFSGSISIAPNPSYGKFTIKTGAIEEKNASLKITDTRGTLVKTFNIDLTARHSFDLDLSNYSKGVYFVELRSNDKVFNARVVIL